MTTDPLGSDHALAERVKELTALHSVSTIILDDDLDTAAVIREMAAILPPAFQYPDVTAARVRLGPHEAVTPGFVESPDALRSDFKLADGSSGSLEVIYTDSRPEAAIGPFLLEERSLLRTLSDMLRSGYDRKQAMAALRDSEARMRFYASSTFEGIVVHVHGSFVEVNEQFAMLIGVPAKALVGTAVDAVIAPELRDAFRQHLRERSGEPFAARLLRKDGVLLTVEVRTTAAVHGGLTSSVSVFRDITERKQLEEQLHRTLRLESLGTLAAGIAHDLNNVLAPVLLSVSVLQRRLADPTLRRLVDSLATSANRGKEIIRQILMFARGSREPFAPVQIERLVSEIESFMRHSFGAGITIRLEFPEGLQPVMADATQLHQVLLNLCVNARDAMNGNGIITILAANTHIAPQEAAEHSGVNAGHYVMLAVADTGPGIAPEIRNRIFEPFFSTKDVGKGTGLGLSTVKAIVREHHGFLTVKTEAGEGSEFRVFIPVAHDVVDVRTSEEQLPSGNGEHILIVDDEQSILHIAYETLQTYGYRVSTAADGPEATALLEKAERGSVHLLLTDASMPSMNGIEVIRAVRDLDANIRVVLSTGSLDDTQREQLEPLRIDGYLNKPYTSGELLKLLRKLFDARPVRVNAPR